MRLSLDLGLGSIASLNAGGGWWPSGAVFAYDPLRSRAMVDGSAVDPATIISCSREASGYHRTVAGVYQSFGANVLRITDRGLLVEPARTNLVTYLKDIAQYGNVSGTAPTRTNLVTTELGIFDQGQLVASPNSTTTIGISTPTYALTAASEYAMSVWFKAGTTGQARFVERDTTNVLNSNINGLISALAATSSSAGALTDVLTEDVGTGKLLTSAFVPLNTATHAIRLGPNGLGDITILAAQIELGHKPTSPILSAGSAAARDADVVTLALGADDLDLTFWFYDGTFEVIPQVSGDYAIPTDLSRSEIIMVSGAPYVPPGAATVFVLPDGPSQMTSGKGPSGLGVVERESDGKIFITTDGRPYDNVTAYSAGICQYSEDKATFDFEWKFSDIYPTRWGDRPDLVPPKLAGEGMSGQGLSIDPVDGTLWAIAKDGDDVGRTSALHFDPVAAASGTAADGFIAQFPLSDTTNAIVALSNSLMLTAGSTSFQFRNKSTFASVGGSYALSGIEQACEHAATNHLFITKGENNEPGQLLRFSIGATAAACVYEKTFILPRATAIEGPFIAGWRNRLMIMHDGNRHLVLVGSRFNELQEYDIEGLFD